jgi:hypothetical protein
VLKNQMVDVLTEKIRTLQEAADGVDDGMLRDVMFVWSLARGQAASCNAGELRYQHRQLRSKARTDLADVVAGPGAKKKTGEWCMLVVRRCPASEGRCGCGRRRVGVWCV